MIWYRVEGYKDVAAIEIMLDNNEDFYRTIMIVKMEIKVLSFPPCRTPH